MQTQLVEILRSKGIGPKGSKQLSNENIQLVPELLWSESCNLVTKATFLTALLLLDRNTEEHILLNILNENLSKLPRELHFLLTKKSSIIEEEIINKLIQKIDLNENEAKLSIGLFLDTEEKPYLQAAYLEALRLKRETDLENKIFYQYFLKQCSRRIINSEPIIEIGDSFDGMNRNFNFNLITGCLLAALGHKVLLTGCETVAPKKGITHHQILKGFDKNPLQSMEEAEIQLKSSGITYLDQSIFHPELHQKTEMREAMVKRPFLATFEKILSPICSDKGNYVTTSYTHAHYKNANIEIFRSSPYINKALNIKGLEGTIHPKSNISTLVLCYSKYNELTEFNHKFIGDLEENNLEINLENHLLLIQDFLEKGKKNYVYHYVVNTCILILSGLGLISNLEDSISKMSDLIEKGEVLAIWNKIN